MQPVRRDVIDRQRVSGIYVRSIPLDIVLTLITCGLWNIVVQYKQMQAINWMLGTEKYNFFRWALFTIFTCGLYHLYHEFIVSKDLDLVRGIQDSNTPIIHLVISIFGLSIITDALQQSEINNYFMNTTNAL